MIKQGSNVVALFPSTPSMSETMFFEESYLDSDLNPGQILDWLEDPIPQLPLILDDLYCSTDDPWRGLDRIDSSSEFLDNFSPPVDLVITDQTLHLSSDLSKKRKSSDDYLPRGKKKSTEKSRKDDSGVGNSKDGRWAEQLLNPCAEAITTGNMTRVQHFLIVLQELASPTGDANYTLATHGMQALLRHLSATNNPTTTVSVPVTPAGPTSFATSSPGFFKKSLISFNEVNPWFTIPNNIANNTILQVLSEQDSDECRRTLHILDIGVSHGFQWPTLLEALSRRPRGPPPLVRLTVVPPATTLENHETPFTNSPPNYNFASNILRFAKDININLQINTLANVPLQHLTAQIVNSSPDETLIVRAQFRLHSLNHTKPDNRTEFLKLLRTMNPKGVILSDNNMDCTCNTCIGTFVSRFSRSLEYLWRFLDSTSVAYKGREMDERRLIEGEAAKALMNPCEMNERKEKWGERMNGVGFVERGFAGDVVDEARALLKKYDSRWELRVKEEGSVGLWWKGEPVSFCSLWTIDQKTL